MRVRPGTIPRARVVVVAPPPPPTPPTRVVVVGPPPPPPRSIVVDVRPAEPRGQRQIQWTSQADTDAAEESQFAQHDSPQPHCSDDGGVQPADARCADPLSVGSFPCPASLALPPSLPVAVPCCAESDTECLNLARCESGFSCCISNPQRPEQGGIWSEAKGRGSDEAATGQRIQRLEQTGWVTLTQLAHSRSIFCSLSRCVHCLR